MSENVLVSTEETSQNNTDHMNLDCLVCTGLGNASKESQQSPGTTKSDGTAENPIDSSDNVKNDYICKEEPTDSKKTELGELILIHESDNQLLQSEKNASPKPNAVRTNLFPGKMRGSLSSTSSEDVGYCGSCASVENLESPAPLDYFESSRTHGLAKSGRKHDSVLIRWPCDDRLVWSDSAKVSAREVQVGSVEGVDGLSLYQEAISLTAMEKIKMGLKEQFQTQIKMYRRLMLLRSIRNLQQQLQGQQAQLQNYYHIALSAKKELLKHISTPSV
ncbi:UPF0500 protein C1orf216 homolog [Heptranchias perlo]|uniref:UPF0500 protein C1orf216 homolog n=1 Tax=Heptranchias perlo TaxID=212740 RepID=UPI00355A2A1D